MNNPTKLLISLISSLATFCTVAGEPYFHSVPLRSAETEAAPMTPMQQIEPEQSGMTGINRYTDPRMWSDRFREFTLGAVETGVATADFDRDGWMDVFVVSRNGACSLYRQVAPFQFEDVAEVAGVTAEGPENKTGPTVVDINQDGWMDLYLCRLEAPNLLFINNGDGTFTESAASYGLDISDASVHAVFADYDRDGYLDCYIVTNILDFSKSPQGRRDYLLRNNGDGQFVDVSKEAGIWGVSQGHAAIWFDANRDGWPDLYVANDFETPDRFYLNQGDGTFVDVVDIRLPHVTYFSMSADSGDLNNDGYMDFLVTDMRDRTHESFMTGMEEMGRGLWEMERTAELIPQYPWNALYLHSGSDHYLEAAHITGMDATGWTFGTRLADFDNDGYLDVFFATGMIRNFMDADLVDRQNRAPSLAARAQVWRNAPPRNETSMLFRSMGGSDAGLHFEEVSEEWGLSASEVSFGCVAVDLDNNGALDLVVANYDAPPTVIRNLHTSGNRITVKLEDRPPNRDGIGAEIRVVTKSRTQLRQLFTERGIVSSEAPIAHFGLGKDDIIEHLSVTWPNGQVQHLHDLPVNHAYTIQKPPAPTEKHSTPEAQPKSPLLREASQELGLVHANQLMPVNELSRERLLPRRLNGAGPALAVADVNQNGRSDLFVSGTAQQEGTLFLQQEDGCFEPAPSQPWRNQAESDDVVAVWVDLNADGLPDLLMGAGGVAYTEGDPRLKDRLYLNRGKGEFELADPAHYPVPAISTGTIATGDFDADGQVDLFVGARVTPGNYPNAPSSYLLRNDNGVLVDVTDTLAPELRNIGMVTRSTFADVDLDGLPDLVLTREWGPVSVWRNTGTGFECITAASGLSVRTGWWSALAIHDVDGDGRPDIIAGNNGLNTKYSASKDAPTVLLAGVFDSSGTHQLVEAKTIDGRLLPVRGRSKLSYSFPWMPSRFRTFLDYANASIEEIFDPEALASVRRLEATELASGIFFNRLDASGRMYFEFKPLPRMAQLAPIFDWLVEDLTGDGIADLIGVGNHFGPEPSTGRFDGGVGIVLKGQPNGEFEPLLPGHSGWVVPGESRSVASIPLANGSRAIAVARTRGPLQVFVSE